VCGVLAVSRALGDHGMKEFVVARPYLSVCTVVCESPGTHSDFCVVACDGLWDVMSDEEVGDFVLSNGGKSEAGISRKLIDEALNRGSTDNISAVVLFF